MPWRPAYECYAGLGWLLACAFFLGAAVRDGAPLSLGAGLGVVCFAFGALRWWHGLRVLTVRAALCGRAMEVVKTVRLRKLCRQASEVFLGFGFEWQPVHSQRLHELAKVDYRQYAISPLVLRFLGYEVKPQPVSEFGLPYIHGVEPTERALYRPLVNFEGGTLIVGATQSGKGVVLSALISQAIWRGDVVIVLDPKNSRRLKRNVIRACEDARGKETFLEFHSAFTVRS